MKNQKGFSLIELLIVVVIIGIIAAIAIPNLLAARRSANEGSAIASLRTLHGANMTYAATHGNGSFAGTSGAVGILGLQELAATGLVDNVLGGVDGSADKSGYVFVTQSDDATATAPAVFLFSTIPVSPTGITQSGSRRFCVETDGVMRVDTATLNAQFPASGTGAAPAAGSCATFGPTNG